MSKRLLVTWLIVLALLTLGGLVLVRSRTPSSPPREQSSSLDQLQIQTQNPQPAGHNLTNP